MRVQFEFNHDDLIDATRRFLARSKAVSRWRVKEMIWTGALVWIILFLLFRRNPVTAAIFALVAAMAGAFIYPVLLKRETERRLRKYYEEKFGNERSFLCEVEITPSGVTTTQKDHEHKFPWSSVEEIQDTNDSVDIFTREGGGVIVRNRAFHSPEERTRFVQMARSFQADAAGQSLSTTNQ